MRPDRLRFILRQTTFRPYCRTAFSSPATLRPSRQIRLRHDESYRAAQVDSVGPRNPLDYVNADRASSQHNSATKRRMIAAGVGLAICLGAQAYLFHTHREPSSSHRLDSPTNPDAPPLQQQEIEVRVIQPKPGNPDIKVDAQGNELVDTGTSSIPHFPRTIKLASSSPDPGAQPSATTSPAAGDTSEEYHLLGLGVRSVSFLRVQVYVLGVYVRTTDLPALQAAFVRHVNPLGTSLIPGEKEELKAQLLDGPGSLALWDKVLRETRVRSAVRIVPTRGTDFNHLRDGWVTGITSRTQELAKQAAQAAKDAAKDVAGGAVPAPAAAAEYEDAAFGAAMQEFKALFGGRGKAPKGSTVLLTRDEHGALSVLFDRASSTKSDDQPPRPDAPAAAELLGSLADERVSRQVWLGYLGGKNVSSEPARKSVVDGVMELVERPVGTVGMAVS